MSDVLVDSNVVFDLLAERSDWFDWSLDALAQAACEGRTLINPIIYAEISAGFASPDDATRAVTKLALGKADLPWDAAFLAGQAFVKYRRQGGEKRSPLPDFYIGAHAAAAGLRLLTRDPKRYRAYFNGLVIISPEGEA